MTTYSVYDHALGRYAYYEAAVPVPPTGWFRRPAGVPAGQSAPPESLAVRVPAGAKFLSYGPRAQGVIGTIGSLAGSDTPAGPAAPGHPWRMAFALVVAFLVGKVWR